MKLFKLSVLAFSVGLLAACSSGGGGGDNGAAAQNNGKGALTDTSVKPATKSIDLVDEQYKEQVREAKELKLLDGTVIEIVDYPVGIVQEKVNDGIVKGINLPYSVVGGWLPNDVKVDENGLVIDPRVTEDDFDIFGVATTKGQMPVKGVAQYNGYSLGAVTSGKLQLNVDFGNETVEGKLYDRKFDNGQQLPDITLNKGTITEGDPNIGKKDVMAFSGMATYKGVEGVYIGSFMGPNAEEVAGAVGSEEHGIYEAFGGQRGEIKK
ncbi:transferrin-binding protein-like solute binding protein [Gallibacterium salpingitidis]|uniref:factor H binding protein domain-containing protein n=1 Tax=Gallibacterium salpingitidis TaxID=505341 RepID=UPI00266FA308|nr:factor H binding protein domain-containing protein [Gallibacterium salpingitidis]WKS98736.1 transferrin-binding protein-like solute binding protein [Gallibacterium salpingitidis]